MSKSAFGSFVRTIESDDEIDTIDDHLSGDESEVQVKKNKKKEKKQSKSEIAEQQHIATRGAFFSDIQTMNDDEEEVNIKKSFKNETIRTLIKNRADLLKKKSEMIKNDEIDEQKIISEVAKEVEKKRLKESYGFDSDDDSGDDSDSDSDDEFSRPVISPEEMAADKLKVAEIAAKRIAQLKADNKRSVEAGKLSDDEEEQWGGEEEDDEDLDDVLNQDIFATQTSITTSDITGENALTVVPKNIDFTDLNLSRALLQGIKHMNFSKPTPIQTAAIPLALSGQDILANAVTGSGKTAAFVLPIIERLLHQTHRANLIRAVIVTPTRELAEQIYKVTYGLAKFTDIKVCCVVGGLSLQVQEAELRAGPDIVVCTPGRLIDHLANSKSVDLEDLEMLVLDEADRLLEMGFIDEVKEIIASCPRSRQTLLFSATLNDNVQELIHLSLKKPKRISVDKSSSIVDTLTQEFVRIRQESNVVREAIVLALCKRSFKSRTIIFCRTKVEAHRLLILFGLCGLKAGELHGNLTQAQRMEALEMFKEHKVDYLICTDLASRGIDIKGVQTVINMHMPRELAQYIHRVGRTARAGNKGRSVSIVSEDERRLLRDIMKAARNVVKKREVPPEIVTKYSKKVSVLAPEVDVILTEERAEKEFRTAERDLQKAENMANHSSEIFARPARTWFQTAKEKDELKKKAALANQTITELKKISDEAREQRAEIAETSGLTKEKDPLLGLSRAKRRRKLLQMEAIKEAKSTARELKDSMSKVNSGEAGMSDKQLQVARRQVEMLLHPERAMKAIKRQEKRTKNEAAVIAEEDGAGPTAFIKAVKDEKKAYFEAQGNKRKRTVDGEVKTKKPKVEKRYMDASSSTFFGNEASGNERFREASRKYNESLQRTVQMAKDRSKPSAGGGFKSQKRFKRRG